MGTLFRPSPVPLLCSSRPKSPFLHPIPRFPSRKFHQRVQSSKFSNFLDLEPVAQPETLDFDLPWFHPSDRHSFDVIIIGSGPAGLRLAERCPGMGLRPVLSYMEVKKRMVARLRHLGIKVRSVIEDEKCLIPMGGPLPQIPQRLMAIGGNSGTVHPSTGYLVARTMALAPVLAEAIAECLGSTRMIRGMPLCHKVWNGLWPVERRCTRECYRFGMETLLRLDLKGTRNFFDAFFSLDPHYWHGYMSSRLSVGELAMLSLSLFGHASSSSKLDIVTKCPAPLVKLMGNLALENI